MERAKWDKGLCAFFGFLCVRLSENCWSKSTETSRKLNCASQREYVVMLKPKHMEWKFSSALVVARFWVCRHGEWSEVYLHVMVNCFVQCPHHCTVVYCLQAAEPVTLLRARGAGEAGHPVQCDGTLCGEESWVNRVWSRGEGPTEGRAPICSVVPFTDSSDCVRLSLQDSPQAVRTLQPDAGHTGHEVPQGGWSMGRWSPGIKLSKIRV